MSYEIYMKKCFELARMGEGKTSPNPMVGCVVLNSDGKEIANGYHKSYGGAHAEACALNKLNDEARGGTLIVNLEPCSHFGKTPPCADLIVEKGIARVVIAMRDPNQIVAGRGIDKLKNAGIEVVGRVLEDEARGLNEVFIKNHEKKAVFIAIKTATTLDGKIATKSGSSKWITSAPAREEVKQIRARYDAILTSSSTVLADNPTMAHDIKIILDRKLKTNFEAKIYQAGKVYVVVDENIELPTPPVNVEFIKCPTFCHPEFIAGSKYKLDLEFLFKKLYELGIMSVLIEAGGEVNGSALEFVDKIYQFIAPKILADNSARSCFDGKNIENINQALNFKIHSVKHFEPDILLILNNSGHPELVSGAHQ